MDGQAGEWGMGGWVDGCMGEWMHGCVGGWMDV